MSDIGRWLEGLGLGRYAEAFAESEIDFGVLPDLTDADLESLGIPLGPRKKLLKAIAALNADESLALPRAADALAPSTPTRAATGEAERRQLTVMFVDLVGSTELSRRLDPEELRELLRAYQDTLRTEVARYAGHVARYFGDGALVYFGYPQAHEDDAVRAIYAGLAVTRAVKQLGKRMLQAHGGRLRARVGIATGPVVVGDLVGAAGSEADAVTGETPNLAARLQDIAGSGRVAVAERTRTLAGDAFTYEAPEERPLKGFPEQVRLWRVLGPSGAQSRFEALHGRWLTPMVGREQEIGLLLERWRQAKEGEGQVVMVLGEAGIGKSRITEVLHERLQADGPIRIRLQCSPYHTNSALYPVIEHLERAAKFEPDEPSSTRLEKVEGLVGQVGPVASETVSLLAALLSVPTGDRYPPLAMSPERQKELTLAALTEQLVGLAMKRPLLVVLEDAHWIDPTTLEAIDLTIAQAEHAPMLVVITFRPELEPRWVARPHATLLALNRLTKRQGAEMVEGVTGGRALPPEVLEQVVARTDGVPLFLEELTRMVLESGLLKEEGGRYVLEGPLPPLAIPATLQDSLMARLDRLAPAKHVAQTAAAIGRSFRHDLLSAVAAMDEAKLIEALGQLVEAGLVFRQGTPPAATYAFKHALVQAAAYESLLKSQRQRIHARIATVLEQQFPEVAESAPEVIGRHYAEAGLAEPAIDWWYRAGRRAVDRSACLEAVTILSKALDLLDSQPNRAQLRDRELDILTALGSAYITATGYAAPETGEIYARAQALCEDIGESARVLPILYGMWTFYSNGGNFGEVLNRIHYAGHDNLASVSMQDETVAIEEVARFKQAGGDTVVEVSSIGLCRDPAGLARIARATGLNIVMGCSYYVGATHPPDMDAKSEADITREIVTELQVGADGTGVRPGIIGEVGCSWPLLPNEHKALRASARAQRWTGAPLMIHPGRNERAPWEIVQILAEAGADLSRTIMCHIDRTLFRHETLRELARTGCIIEYDLFGHEHALYVPNLEVDQPNDAMRLRWLRWLIDEGFGRQIVISHDIDNQIYLSRFGGPGYAHILENIVPLMRRRGFWEEEIDAILIDTPRRLFTFVPPERA